jgi:hypothetical protein
MPKLTKHQLQKDQLRQRAIDMHNQDIPQPRIIQELQISKSTLRRWLRDLGVPPKESRYHTNTKMGEPKVDPVEEVLATNLVGVLGDSIRLSKTNERQAEDLAILEHAAAQTSPAEKYQSYIAAGAVKLMRDSLKLVKPAKNIRELDQLDIDVSILTNSKAALHEGAVGVGGVPTHTIDVKTLRQKKKSEAIDVEDESNEE